MQFWAACLGFSLRGSEFLSPDESLRRYYANFKIDIGRRPFVTGLYKTRTVTHASRIAQYASYFPSTK